MNDLHYDDLSAETSFTPGKRSIPTGIWVGLFGAPLAWIAQVSLSEPLAAHACYPFQTPLTEPIWAGLPVILATISLACLTAALLADLSVWNSWRRLQHDFAGEADIAKDGVGHRNWFLLNLGAMSSFLFTVAIVFNICAIWLVSPCSPWS